MNDSWANDNTMTMLSTVKTLSVSILLAMSEKNLNRIQHIELEDYVTRNTFQWFVFLRKCFSHQSKANMFCKRTFSGYVVIDEAETNPFYF